MVPQINPAMQVSSCLFKNNFLIKPYIKADL